MNKDCSKIIFTNRAYYSILSETYDKIRTETGGILLGRIVGDIWYVIEVIDPGPNSTLKPAYFEYDTAYVNHLAKVVSKLYKFELAVLGLWHRHPGSMDTFSSTDDLTNSEFSEGHPKGAISGLVNIDPDFRLTMYHVSMPLKYIITPFEIGNSLTPSNLLSFKYEGVISGLRENRTQKIQNRPIEKKKGIQNYINLIVRPFFRNIETTIIKDSFLSPSNNLHVEKNLVEDHLVDLYASEEIQMEKYLKVSYESEVEQGRLVYCVDKFLDGTKLQLPIFFSVNLDIGDPLFFCDGIIFKFKKGIFMRFVDSKLNNTDFFG
jgi:proteasome lid subunit RPN8/RPN11